MMLTFTPSILRQMRRWNTYSNVGRRLRRAAGIMRLQRLYFTAQIATLLFIEMLWSPYSLLPYPLSSLSVTLRLTIICVCLPAEVETAPYKWPLVGSYAWPLPSTFSNEALYAKMQATVTFVSYGYRTRSLVLTYFGTWEEHAEGNVSFRKDRCRVRTV
jgi:hypothetical protein